MDWLRHIVIAECVVVGALYTWTMCKAAFYLKNVNDLPAQKRWNLGRALAGLGILCVNIGFVALFIERLGDPYKPFTWIVGIGQLALFYGWIVAGRITMKEGHPVG